MAQGYARRGLGGALGLALVLWLWSLGAPRLAAAQPPPIRYERYDVAFQVLPNGDFLVREIQQVRFDGTFTTAFAEIPRRYSTDIDAIRLLEGTTPYQRFGSGPGSYDITLSGDTIEIDWEYYPTRAGDVRTFILEYRVSGGLWVYPDGDLLEWRAVPEDRSGVPVETSRVTVTLPLDVPVADLRYTAFGAPFRAEASPGQVIFQSEGSLQDGTAFQVLVGFPHGLVEAEVQPWQAVEDAARLDYTIPMAASDITINPDGTLLVEEQQRVSVSAGTMTEGARTLRLSALDEVSDVQVWEGESPFEPGWATCEARCFEVSQQPRSPGWVRASAEGLTIDEGLAGQSEIRWRFPPLVKGEETTFHLRYRAHGALRPMPDAQELVWTVVPAERRAAVAEATLRLHLPPGVAPEAVEVVGASATPEGDDTLRLSHAGPIPVGQPWTIRLHLPPGATSAPTPLWLREQESAVAEMVAAREAAQQAAIRLARTQVALGAAAMTILVAGLLGIGLLWYGWGRDPAVPLVSDYLAEPPSNLPPALVAYLLDERPSAKGALAALFHLGSLGLVRIGTESPLTLQRTYPALLEAGQTLITPDGVTTVIPPHLVMLFNRLAESLPTSKAMRFSQLSTPYGQALPAVYREMAAEADAYFTSQPTVARHRWLVAGQWLALLGAAGALASLCGPLQQYGAVVLTPALALVVVGLVLFLVSRWMGQKTSVGAVEAARWQAFRRYLLDLRRYGSLESAQALLDRFFPYAVALGVERPVLEQATAMGAQPPAWTRPARILTDPDPTSTPTQRRPLRVEFDPSPLPVPPRPASGVWALDAPPAPDTPSLQTLSDRMASALNLATTDLSAVLDWASGSADDTPFRLVLQGARGSTNFLIDAASSTAEVLGEILEATASESSGGGSSSYSSGSSSRRSSGWSSSSGSSSRSSSSRRSGGGGRRGFG